LIYKETNQYAYLITIGALLCVGVLLCLIRPKTTKIFAREGFILVGLWITDVFIEIIRLVFDIHRRRVYEKIKREIEVAKQSKDKAVDNLNRVKNSVKERMKNAKKQLSKSKEENQPNKSLNE
jgi:uncharacterized membrane protein